MKHVFIINSKSAKKKREHLQKEIKRVFAEKDYVIEWTQYKGHAKVLAVQYAKTADLIRIYACGGDGTLHEIVNGIMHYDNVQLAVIPIGTGNDFVKSFAGFSREIFLSLENYRDPVICHSDLLMVDDEASINTVSAGLDVKVAYHVDKFKQLRFLGGIVPYVLGLFVSMCTRMDQRFGIEIDGIKQPLKNYLFVVAGNGRYYGGGFCPAPNAKINDGFFDYSLIEKVSRFKIIRLAGKYKTGEHTAYHNLVSSGKARTLCLDSEGKTIRLNLDGELYETKNPKITLRPNMICLILPENKKPAEPMSLS